MQTLTLINQIVIGIVSVAFTFQIIYLFLFFLKPEKYPAAKRKHKFAVIVCAHDEGSVIGATVRNLALQKYDKENYKIFVVADNCSDDTAEEARKAGATVFERNESDLKKRGAAYALKFGIARILEEYPEVEAFIRFDADNFPLPDYIDKMNDAFDSGITLARGYNHATNITQNIVSGVSGLWYIRDCRFNCHARSALRIGEMLVGGGMMFSADIMREQGGWKEMTFSEDAEFTCNQLFKKRKAHYVSDAVVYEDQPSTVGQLFKRNMRMGRGLLRLFFTHGLRCLWDFLISFRYSFLDMFLTLLFIPIAGLCCFWFPTYYAILFSQCLAPLTQAQFVWEVMNVVYILAFAFVIPFILQAFLVYGLDKKKIGVPLKKLLPAIVSFPLFMVVYALGITAGFLFRAKWKSVGRSKFYDESFVKKIEAETGVSFDYILNGAKTEPVDCNTETPVDNDKPIGDFPENVAEETESIAEVAATTTETEE